MPFSISKAVRENMIHHHIPSPLRHGDHILSAQIGELEVLCPVPVHILRKDPATKAFGAALTIFQIKIVAYSGVIGFKTTLKMIIDII